MPRTLAIGDIHGCFTALETLVDFAAVAPDDLVITLGDYVNRGPNSRAVLDWLIRRQATGNLVALRGNHEIMTLDARDDEGLRRHWLEYGGVATLKSYARFESDRPTLDDVPEEHWSFLENCLHPFFETERHFFVHANAFPSIALAEQPEFMLYWERFDDPPPHESGKIMVCGHTSQPSGLPRTNGHAICIDTCAYGGGWLTALDIDSGTLWQANEAAQTRKLDLRDL